MWSFDKLPDEVKGIVRELYAQGNFVEIMKIYNQHNVSPDYLTPCCSMKKIIRWTNWALEQGKI